MARGRARLEWDQTATLLGVLEKCRQMDGQYEIGRWMPEHLRPKPISTEKPLDVERHKANVAEFNALLRAGAR